MASSRQFVSQIKGRYPKSDAEDLIAMMNVLARVWAEAKRQSESGVSGNVKASKKDYRLAARIFCVLHDPLQPASLPGQIAYLAETYRGISRDPKIHAKFRQSISIGLLTLCKDARAVLSELAKTGVGGLFRL